MLDDVTCDARQHQAKGCCSETIARDVSHAFICIRVLLNRLLTSQNPDILVALGLYGEHYSRQINTSRILSGLTRGRIVPDIVPLSIKTVLLGISPYSMESVVRFALLQAVDDEDNWRQNSEYLDANQAST